MKKYITLAFIFISTNCIAQLNVPQKQSGYINDYVGALSSSEKDDLNNKVMDIKKQSSIEITVVVLNDLQGYTAQQASFDIGRAWGVGKKGLNNGLVYLVSPQNHSAFISTGYGLEGELPDATCKEISDEGVPYFKKSEWYNGIRKVITELGQHLNPTYKAQQLAYQQQQAKDAAATRQTIFAWVGYILLFLIPATLIFYIEKRRRRYNKFKLLIKNYNNSIRDTYDSILMKYNSIAESEFNLEQKSFLSDLAKLTDIISELTPVNYENSKSSFETLQRTITGSVFSSISNFKSISSQMEIARTNSQQLVSQITRLIADNKTILKTDFIPQFASAQAAGSILNKYKNLKTLYDNVIHELTYNVPESEMFRKRLVDNKRTYEFKINNMVSIINKYETLYPSELAFLGLFTYNDTDDYEKVFNKCTLYYNNLIEVVTDKIPQSDLFKQRVEKEEEEERLEHEREQKRKKEEEEEEERNRLSSIAMASSYSSSNDSFRSSSNDSFGGGSFGGGGGGSNW